MFKTLCTCIRCCTDVFDPADDDDDDDFAEILERLKRGGEHEFRPSADVPANLSEFRALMTSCWGEDSRTRPTVVWVKKQLKGMAA